MESVWKFGRVQADSGGNPKPEGRNPTVKSEGRNPKSEKLQKSAEMPLLLPLLQRMEERAGGEEARSVACAKGIGKSPAKIYVRNFLHRLRPAD